MAFNAQDMCTCGHGYVNHDVTSLACRFAGVIPAQSCGCQGFVNGRQNLQPSAVIVKAAIPSSAPSGSGLLTGNANF